MKKKGRRVAEGRTHKMKTDQCENMTEGGEEKIGEGKHFQNEGLRPGEGGGKRHEVPKGGVMGRIEKSLEQHLLHFRKEWKLGTL